MDMQVTHSNRIETPCRITIDIGHREKRMKGEATSVIVELRYNNEPRGDQSLHEKEYNTRYAVSAISNAVCGEIRREPRQPEV